MDKNSKSLLAEKIRKELVETNYYNDVKYNLASKSRWKVVSDVSEAIAHTLLVVTSILAFSAGVFDYMLLSFVAGCSGTLSLALLRFSSYSMMESKERTHQVNLLLENIGIEPIVDIIVDQDKYLLNNNKRENKFDLMGEDELEINLDISNNKPDSPKLDIS